MFPSCDIKEIARKLMMSAIFTDKLQPGFDVLTCLKGLFKHLLHDNNFCGCLVVSYCSIKSEIRHNDSYVAYSTTHVA
jgi:hypothetical protein